MNVRNAIRGRGAPKDADRATNGLLDMNSSEHFVMRNWSIQWVHAVSKSLTCSADI
jgi:hypothetical protein